MITEKRDIKATAIGMATKWLKRNFQNYTLPLQVRRILTSGQYIMKTTVSAKKSKDIFLKVVDGEVKQTSVTEWDENDPDVAEAAKTTFKRFLFEAAKVAELLENTSKKYTFVDADTRIVALRNFGEVKKGDSGGFIASEANLSHDGLCWVGGDARVTAFVSENALVTENARVYGDAWVYGNARVGGYARIAGFAHVYGNARVTENARVGGDARIAGNARVGGQSIIVDNERFCKTYLHLESLNFAADPVNKDLLLRALLTTYKKNPETWSAQIGLFIDELRRQEGVRYPELASIQKSAKNYN